MKDKKINKKKVLIFTSIGLLVLILISIPIILLNISGRKMEKYSEITFVTPTDAIVFWKSEKETLGYIEYSSKKFGKRDRVLQTSSEPGEVHVVFLENIPLEGIYIRKINESDSIFYFQPIVHIKYENNESE